MNTALRLTIATPDKAVIDEHGVRAIRANDGSGSFGILPGHADLLTVLPASVVRWRDALDAPRFCAVQGGVMSLTGGSHVAIACRQARLGDRLETLEAEILAARAAQDEADKQAHVAQTRLHARAVRQLIRYLMPAGDPTGTQTIFPDEPT